MSHPIHRVTRFSVVGPYTVSVTFTDGTEQRIDFTPVLHGVLFGPPQDLATFNAVSLDPEGRRTRVAEWSGLRSRNAARLALGV